MGVVDPEHPWQHYTPEVPAAELERTFLGIPLPTNYSSSALEKSRVVATQGCRLEGFTALNTLNATQYIMVFDSPVLPADGTVAAMVFSVATNSSVGAYWGTTGRWMQFGLTICNSTTVTSKTLGAANCAFDVQYTLIGY